MCVVEFYVVDGALVGTGVTLSCSVDLFPTAQLAAVDRCVCVCLCHFPNDLLVQQFVDTSPYSFFSLFYLHSIKIMFFFRKDSRARII